VPAFQPENLRNRVAATARRNTETGPYDYLSHYRYDEHGNVKELINEFTELHAFGQGYKRLRYEYDLISGNVKRFAYQENEPDQWIHRYFYDASNRLTVAQTSTNNISWDRDEKAFYYLHGARARQEIGEEKVQALDYAHTIHGWIRGVNSGILDPNRDMGSDGKTATTNRWVGRDAWAFELGFYQGDYQSIGGTQWETSVNSTFAAAQIKDLYNGNIAWQVISNKKLMEDGAANATVNQNPFLKRYQYDQLNRLKSMDVFTDGTVTGGNTWSASTAISSDYHTDYKYAEGPPVVEPQREYPDP
jgi:YD repeat-containing protein